MAGNRLGIGGVAMAFTLLTPFALAAQHAHAGHGAPDDAEATAVRAVVSSAYIDGIQKNGSRAAIRRGFHPGFVMKVLRDGQMTDVTIEEWIARLPAEGTPSRGRIEARYPSVSVTGDAAVAVVEVMRDGTHVFTDYITLYRFPEGWRIVGKIFQAHTG